MTIKHQAKRLSNQFDDENNQKSIFNKQAKIHDDLILEASLAIFKKLEQKYKNLNFKFEKKIYKSEINNKLREINPEFEKNLFVKKSFIEPDGGIISVKDKKISEELF